MKEWLGIVGYSLKDCILNAVATSATDLNAPQRTAGHKSQSNTKRYTKAIAISDNLRVNKKLVITGLHSRFGSYDEAQVISFLLRS